MGFVLRAKLGHVYVVGRAIEHTVDSVTQLVGVGVLPLDTGGEKAADQVALDRLDRVRLRHADDGGILARLGQDIPHALLVDGVAGGDGHAVVGVVGPVAKAVKAQHTRVLAGEHRRPRRDGDAGDRAGERPVDALIDQAAQGGQSILQAHRPFSAGLEQHRRRGAVQAEDEHLARLVTAK